MIIEEFVEIKIVPKTVKHFEALGYVIPRYQWRNKTTGQVFKKIKVKRGTKITVSTLDLVSGSCYKVLFQCNECGEIKRQQRRTVANSHLCLACATKKACFKGGLPKCIGCGNELSRHDSLKVGTGYCRKCYRGEKNKRWNPYLDDGIRKNGRSINPEYYQWRLLVFERDGYRCKRCGDNKGGNLVAHHIKKFSDYVDLRFDVDNGVTWCNECHVNYHNKYGY
jgi:hypothetical protein